MAGEPLAARGRHPALRNYSIQLLPGAAFLNYTGVSNGGGGTRLFAIPMVGGRQSRLPAAISTILALARSTLSSAIARLSQIGYET